jgi:multiple sugar transport system substrate-binding protein
MGDAQVPGEISRRSLLKGAVAGTALGATSVLGSQFYAAPAMGAGKSVSIGSFHLDPTVRLTDKEFIAAAAKAGFEVKIEDIDHLITQSQLTTYLQANPADLVEFGGGYRLQYAASKGLVADLTDVWIKATRNIPRSYKVDSTAADGKQYLIPVARYPWAVMYRKSIFRAAGIDASTIITWADFINACKIFKSKGLTPIALGDASGWEALGTFEFVNLRTNGFKFHRDLLSGRASWNDARVQKTFRNWESMFPYQNSNALELDWASAGRLVLQNKAAMQVMGSFHAQLYTDSSDLADLGLFAFPEISKAYHRTSLVAPVNGFAISKAAQKNIANAKSLATWLASAEYANEIVAQSPTTLVANSGAVLADSAFVRQQAALVKASKYFTQTFGRDMRPDFAGPIAGPAMQAFLKNPGDKKKIAANLAAQWTGLPS